MNVLQKIEDRSLFAVALCAIDRISQRMEYLKKTGRLSAEDWDLLNEPIEDMRHETVYIQSKDETPEVVKGAWIINRE